MTSVVGCDRKELALLGKVCKMAGAARGWNKLVEQTSRQSRGGRWLRGQWRPEWSGGKGRMGEFTRRDA